ncbi:MAG: sensor histidine kinase [Stellaceae bacterium]
MRLLADMPIRWKLVAVTLLTGIIAQSFAGAILAAYDSHEFHQRKTREISAEAAILAGSVTASLAFSDNHAADGYLAALKANPEIAAAAVYDAKGRLFARYLRRDRDAAPVPAASGPIGQSFHDNQLAVVVPVIQNGDRLGTVYLRATTAPMIWRLFSYIGILLLAALGSLAVAVPIALRLNAEIANPIRRIAAAATRIAKGDLMTDLAAPPRRDEIGRLAEAFVQMVASLREMTGELEQRVRQRTAQLEVANKELEAFSYSVSHDLRAPLRAIDGFARILEEDYADRLDDEGRRLMSVVRNNSRKMGTLIDDLLAFSRIGRQSIRRAPIDMTVLAQEAWTEIKDDHLDYGATFVLDALPPAEGDPTLLRQVWTNLLSNAAKYSSQQAAPRIVVGAAEIEREIVYRVEDNGAGFDMKYYSKLFGVFQRLHSAAQYPGTGVGLAIVQRIGLRHGGRVWGEGEIGRGARFYFSLPKPKPEPTPEPEPESTSESETEPAPDAMPQSPNAAAMLEPSSTGS